jgi:hypothetical protein
VLKENENTFFFEGKKMRTPVLKKRGKKIGTEWAAMYQGQPDML